MSKIRLSMIALSICIVLVFLSVSWANAFDFVSEGAMSAREVLLVASFCLGVLTLAICISMWLKHSPPSSSIKYFAAVLTIIGVEMFSVWTSTSSLTNRIHHTARHQNVESAEYTVALDRVTLLTNQINMATINTNNLPRDHHTAKRRAITTIQEMNKDLERAQDRLDKVQVSSVGKTFDSIRNATGLKPEYLMFLAALLLTIGPHTLIALAFPKSYPRGHD